MVFFLIQTTVYFFINKDMNKLFYSLATVTLLNANITHAKNILILAQTSQSTTQSTKSATMTMFNYSGCNFK